MRGNLLTYGLDLICKLVGRGDGYGLVDEDDTGGTVDECERCG